VATVTFNPGDITQNLDVTLLPDSALEGTETVIAAVAAGTGYAVGTQALTAGASADLIDDEIPAENVLFSDDFTDPNDGANWTLRFGSVNPDSLDFNATFAFDYSQLGIPPAPRSNGDTLGLFLSVNK